MPCSFEHEDHLMAAGVSPVAGIDEAGRGPLAGPVVAAAVILPRTFDTRGLDDSKKMTAGARLELYDRLTETPDVVWSCAYRTSEQIDRVNILRACHEAMREAVLGLGVSPAHVLIDGLPVRDFPVPQTAVVGGDGCSFSIAAASVIAKVSRDRAMEEFDRTYPQYGFSRHKGYATAEHLDRLRVHGPCPIHRRSYSPVAQAELF
ncbi:MAG: ribonuclease HII [Terrimicrobiaceae bacterium]|nr:ribonuclease HII [Terrimicrobiaceae bacterium]